MSKVRAKIVEVIDEYHVVINAGENDGVDEGDSVFVIGGSKEVKDPETNEVIEKIDVLHKAHLTVIEVHKRVSLCKSIKITKHPYFMIPELKIYETHENKQQLSIRIEEATRDWPSLEYIELGDTVVIYKSK